MTKIGDVMKKEVVMVDENITVEAACILMGEKRIGSVIVTRDGKPFGIFTERDLLSKVVTKGVDMKEAKVKDYTSEPLVTVNPDFHVREAARIMGHMGIKRLVVMKNNELVGILTAADLVDIISKSPLEF